MNRTLLAIAIATSLSVTAGTLSANEEKRETGNHSGVPAPVEGTSAIPAELADEGAGDSFEDLDRNRDRELDEEELSTYGSTAAGPDAAAPEADKDGEKTEEELSTYGSTAAGPDAAAPGKDGERLMDKYDRDDSGTLNEDEWAEYQEDKKNHQR